MALLQHRTYADRYNVERPVLTIGGQALQGGISLTQKKALLILSELDSVIAFAGSPEIAEKERIAAILAIKAHKANLVKQAKRTSVASFLNLMAGLKYLIFRK